MGLTKKKVLHHFFFGHFFLPTPSPESSILFYTAHTCVTLEPLEKIVPFKPYFWVCTLIRPCLYLLFFGVKSIKHKARHQFLAASGGRKIFLFLPHSPMILGPPHQGPERLFPPRKFLGTPLRSPRPLAMYGGNTM